MNLFELFVKIGVDDQASDKLSGLSSKLGNGLKTAAKIGTAAVGAAATGITALITAAVNNYAEYEQLVGGVETLFKDSANALMSYAGDAYKAQGISANEYMSLATSFSASLLQSLEGDTDRAVEATNLAITDMSDNANKMGTSMEMIQNAYNGFAKANYTMLDNLKLGYGGTKEEMERLIADAAELSDTVDAQSMSFANIVEAIHVVQTEMGITGTTALEASTTISGSVGTMKAAWADFLTSLADENADYQWQLDNLLESVKTVANNVYPVVEQVLWSITDMVEDVLPEIAAKIPEIISEVLPRVTEIAVKLVESLINGISQNQEMLFTSIFDVVTYLADSFIGMLPEIVKLGLDLIVSLANGIAESLPTLIPTIVDVILQIVDTLTDPQNLSNILQAALVLITNLAWGIVNSIPSLIDSVFSVVDGIVTFLLDPQNLAMLIQSAIELVIAIGLGLVEAIPKLMTSVGKLITNIVSYFFNYDWGSLGRNLVDGFKRGIQNAWYNLRSWFSNLFGDLIYIAKRILGIASPSKVFKKIGGFTAEGFGAGFEDEFANVKDDMEDAFNFDDASVGINASIRKVGAGAASGAFGGTSIGNITINIDGAKYSDENALADAIAEKLQMMTDRRAAVYA